MEISISSNNLKKKIVNYFIGLFVIICIIIIVLLILYYLTPNNYKLEKYDKNKYIYVKKITLNILPNSIKKITYNDYLNYYLHSEKDIDLIIGNIFKSQNLNLKPEEIIKIKYNSDLIITNYTDKKITINISLYELNKKLIFN